MDLNYLVPSFAIFASQYVNSFVKIFDIMTKEQGKSIWIEKTPEHINYIDYIQSTIPDTKFIHIIRNGTDVVASLYEVTQNYPDLWGGKLSIDQCIQKWINAFRISKENRNKDNHYVVRYEHLTSNPNELISNICNYLKIEFKTNMLTDYKQTAEHIKLNGEAWKSSITNDIKETTEKKFNIMFSDSQKQHILKEISNYNINSLFE